MFFLQTKDLFLFPSKLKYSKLLLDYEKRNKNFFTPWIEKRDENYFTKKYQYMILKSEKYAIKNNLGLFLYIFHKDYGNKIIGNISVYPIIWGNMKSCTIGYKIDEEFSNKGYMTQALEKTVKFLKNELKIHRIEIFILKNNIPSISLVKKLGFELEGENKKYMEINGVWEDHLRFVMIND